MAEVILDTNHELVVNQDVYSSNGLFKLVLQGDGNLVLYKQQGGQAQPMWATNTAGRGGNKLVMQGDGHLVLYKDNEALWGSCTNGMCSLPYLLLTDRGNLVLRSHDKPDLDILWQSYSGEPWATMRSQVERLSKLESISSPSPSVTSGHFVLYEEANWNSRRVDFDVLAKAPAKRHTLTSDIFDKADLVAWNLPLGHVVTLMDNLEPAPADNPANLAKQGRCIDLVGTGFTESADLRRLAMEDKASTYFWRQVDLNQGAIELFDDFNFRGNKTTLFLSEWKAGKPHNIGDWYLMDRVSSVRWKSLTNRQSVTLYNDWDGTGSSYAGATGWSSVKEVADLGRELFNDRLTSFVWEAVVPVKEEIQPIVIKTDAASDPFFSYVAEARGVNDSSVSQELSYAVAVKKSTTTAVETTDTQVMEISTGMKASHTHGVKDVAQTSVEWTFNVKYGYTMTDKNSRSDTKEESTSLTMKIVAAKQTQWKARMQIMMAELQEKLYTTPVTRWYKVRLPGCIQDGELWKRAEQTSVYLKGTTLSTTDMSTAESALSDPPPKLKDLLPSSRVEDVGITVKPL